MKGIITTVFALLLITGLSAQETVHKDNLNSRTSWLKAGISAGVPVGNTSTISSFTLGGDLVGQMMANPNLGLGVVTGYTHYFGKNGANGFGTIPLGALVRYYPKEPGLLVGSDIGYTFTTDVPNNTGGFYLKPQIGWHNYDWNIYGFYNHVFMNNMSDLGSVGLAVSYNIRFNK